VVVAYGLILPRKVLALPQRGCWNMHASLLPRWRGAAPIQRALLAGDAHTGVCLMQMEAGLDTGPILLERALPIAADDTGGSLHDRLAELGARVLGEGIEHVLRGEAMPPRAQAEQGVTYAHKLEKAEARLDWSESAVVLERKVRAFDPWPVAEATLGGERLRKRCRTVHTRRRAASSGPHAKGSTSPAVTSCCAFANCSARADGAWQRRIT